MIRYVFPLNLVTANGINVTIDRISKPFLGGGDFTVATQVVVSFSGLTNKVFAAHSNTDEKALTLSYLVDTIKACKSSAELEATTFLASVGLKKGDHILVSEEPSADKYKAEIIGYWGSVPRMSKFNKSGVISKRIQCLYGNFEFVRIDSE